MPPPTPMQHLMQVAGTPPNAWTSNVQLPQSTEYRRIIFPGAVHIQPLYQAHAAYVWASHRDVLRDKFSAALGLVLSVRTVRVTKGAGELNRSRIESGASNAGLCASRYINLGLYTTHPTLSYATLQRQHSRNTKVAVPLFLVAN